MSARTLKKLRAAVAGVVLVTFGLAPVAHAMQSVSTTFSMPVQMQASATFDCENSPGPQITFDGALKLGGVNVQLIFRNQREGGAPHERIEQIAVVAAVAAEETIVIPKQPSHDVTFEGGSGTGVGGNPFIWVQLLDSDGNPLTGEIFLGRCVQGPVPMTVDFFNLAFPQALIEVLDCTNNPGPFIYVSGSTSFKGAEARFIFRNNDNPVGGPHEAAAIVDVTVMPERFALQFPKQPVPGLDGVGGNPWISVRFASPNGQPIGNEFLLGRCVQLMPGN